jgi:peptidoglycan/LPS O-acetylase OafA/YrhL
MQCRNCGTDIADNALICYRCGEATTEPQFHPPSRRSSSKVGFILTFVVLLLLVAVTVFLGRSPSGTPQWFTWVIAGVAVVIVALRAYARRR